LTAQQTINRREAVFNGEKLLLVDDDSSLLKLMAMRLSSLNLVVETASNATEALAKIPVFSPQVVVTDLRMGEISGLQLFEKIYQKMPTLPVIIMTAHGTIQEAVQATKQGVFGFITKPIDHEELQEQIEKAIALKPSTSSVNSKKWRRSIIGHSQKLEALLQDVMHVAQSDINVYIQGESGTGKELIAKAIHQASTRKSKPFVAVNCSAIPEDLLESELFGHKRGAFTGAIENRKGLFEQADKGVLFLDEIADTSPAFQVKLLRVLQEGEVRPVGDSKVIKVDVRVISASHKELQKLVDEELFRLDLYYRLNIVNLVVPSLRDRAEDIPLLVDYFIRQQKTKAKNLSNDALEALLSYEWPGNIRELKNVIERLCAFAQTPLVPLSLVEKALSKESGELESFQEARRNFERDYLIRLLKQVNGNVSHAARMAKRNRTEFYRLLERHSLSASDFKTRQEDEM